MSRQFRYRVAALVLGGLLLGVPLLVGGAASAGQRGNDDGRQVIFSGGGMFGFSCRSQPDVESLTVPANSTVRVVNRTGHDANLKLAGKAKGMLPQDESTRVIFRRGTTSMTLTPDCLDGNAIPVQVTASPGVPAVTPDPGPAPSTDDPSGFAADPAGSNGPANAPSAGAQPASHPSRPAPSTGKPAAHPAHHHHHQAKPPRSAVPQVAASKPTVKGLAGTPSSSASAVSGMPPGENDDLLPGVPKDVDVPTEPAETAAPGPSPTEIAAAEPVAAMEPIQRGGPVGLLAVIAGVCVVGVGTAAIRAIVSRRANRRLMT